MNREDYERQYEQYRYMRENAQTDRKRLHYHLMAPSGWLNDPNGLCQLGDTCHIYFQYTPCRAGWGTKLWGHYTTRDWICFQEQEPFHFPDCPWDRDGAYSGSAFVKEGEVHFFYTGNVKLLDKPYDYVTEGREQNTIHVVSKDGCCPGEKRLVLTNEDYPKDMSKHVRDPKIYERDNRYYMVLGGREREDKGCALLFVSDDLEQWSYYDRLTTEKAFGYMWECPDLFDLDGQTLLMVCPQGVEKKGYKYQNLYQCGYFPVKFDPEKGLCRLGDFQELDYGFDIYAPQTFRDAKGRRILIGWMAVPDAKYRYDATVCKDWIHGLTMPRVLSFENGRLMQRPMEEMKRLRISRCQDRMESLPKWRTKDSCFELQIQAGSPLKELRLQLREDVYVIYRNQKLTLLMGESGQGRGERTIELEQLTELTVFSDTSSLEIFVNDGETVLTSRVFGENEMQQVQILSARGEGRAEFYELSAYKTEWICGAESLLLTGAQ